MTRSFIPLLLTLILALVAFADQSNYGDVHKEAQAYKKDVVQEMQNLGDATAAQQSHIKEVEDSVLFFTLHDHNKDGHLDGHELCEYLNFFMFSLMASRLECLNRCDWMEFLDPNEPGFMSLNLTSKSYQLVVYSTLCLSELLRRRGIWTATNQHRIL
ncbi:hypothetical protein BCR33DRAFT_195077 [Rhizoclosmatium globosum]|uniref:EF-hand domain-containing protein n=1 Tax=Rhizoclosmatium globosum TaxID=329046 RepID=A0A1Y2CE37_9FUNG|nr:hypothetical protein BCR33DRAFT_195077 [Rhizoclosmatium globosum]|eukprot:ORY45196.1 hypothetical protein BCR33DRAFT_195077 [Rhizoclosmatium globosum]